MKSSRRIEAGAFEIDHDRNTQRITIVLESPPEMNLLNMLTRQIVGVEITNGTGVNGPGGCRVVIELSEPA